MDIVKDTLTNSFQSKQPCEYIADGETRVIEIIEVEDGCRWNGNPLTYFLYPGITSEDVIRHLKKYGASQACIDKALDDLEVFYMTSLKSSSKNICKHV